MPIIGEGPFIDWNKAILSCHGIEVYPEEVLIVVWKMNIYLSDIYWCTEVNLLLG